MVVAGKIRGNAPQLGLYALNDKNDDAIILDVDGRSNADADYFKNFMLSIELNSQLTRSINSVYHAYISPDPTEKEDRLMTMEEWLRSADILAESLDVSHHRKATIIHDYNGRRHAHVMIERYDHERGVMADHKFNYNAHDKARAKMEIEFGHKRTPIKNVDQPNHKKKLTALWHETATGTEFIKQAQKIGYQIAKGTDRPFRVIDKNGRSFDLARQISGVKTKEIKERLMGINLSNEKDALNQKKQTNTFKENQLLSEAKEPLKQPNMFFEINDEHKQEKQLFDALGKKHLEAIENKHYILSKEYETYEKIPADVLREMKNDRDVWASQWGAYGDDARKIDQRHDMVIDDIMNEMYRGYLISKYADNEKEITEPTNIKITEEPPVSKNISDVTQSEYNKERREFLIQMRDARERNKHLDLQR